MEAQRQADEAGAQRDATRQQLTGVQGQLGIAIQRAANTEAELTNSRSEIGKHAMFRLSHSLPATCKQVGRS